MSLHFNDLFFGSALPFKSIRLQVCGPRSRGPPHHAGGALQYRAHESRVLCVRGATSCLYHFHLHFLFPQFNVNLELHAK